MKFLLKKFKAAYDKKIDGIGLALFRIIFGITLFMEALEIYKYRHLIYDPIPYIDLPEIDLTFGLVIWLVTILFIIIGFYTKIASILNYCFIIVFIANTSSFEYHMFNVYTCISFLWIFMPINSSLSIDRLILKLKYSSSKFEYEPSTKISVLYYFLPLFVGVGLFYLDSVFYKLDSKFWINGLGMWRPSVFPQFNKYGEHFSINNEMLVMFLGYLTLIFEAIFIFIFWFKPFRIPFLIIGLSLHLGILLLFPIPWFAIGVSAIYILFIPVSFWRKLRLYKKEYKPSLYFLYDGDCPICKRVTIVIATFDIFKRIRFIPVQNMGELIKEYPKLSDIKKEELLKNVYSISNKGKIHNGIYTYINVFFKMIYTAPLSLLMIIPGIFHLSRWIYRSIAHHRKLELCNDNNCLVLNPEKNEIDENKKIFSNLTFRKLRIIELSSLFIIFTFLQLIISYNSGIIIKVREKIGLSDLSFDTYFSKFSETTNHYSKKYLGMTHHALFIDGHMDGYNQIITIVHLKNGKEIWLPMYNKSGQPLNMVYGPRWTKWSFRVNSPNLDKYKLENGIRDFSAYWLGYNGIGFKNEEFLVMLKKIDVPTSYSENYLSSQMKKPWLILGKAEWKNEKFSLTINYDLLKIKKKIN
jgi:predicted DCC family thiol-disulfide oxidoreductase YuxK